MGRNQYDLEPELSIAGMAMHEARATVKKAGRMGEPMKEVLRKLNQGLRPTEWLTGSKSYGGWVSASRALHRRGLIDSDDRITELGKKYLRALDLLQ